MYFLEAFLKPDYIEMRNYSGKQSFKEHRGSCCIMTCVHVTIAHFLRIFKCTTVITGNKLPAQI